jgi:hypothetical protein
MWRPAATTLIILLREYTFYNCVLFFLKTPLFFALLWGGGYLVFRVGNFFNWFTLVRQFFYFYFQNLKSFHRRFKGRGRAAVEVGLGRGALAVGALTGALPMVVGTLGALSVPVVGAVATGALPLLPLHVGVGSARHTAALAVVKSLDSVKV